MASENVGHHWDSTGTAGVPRPRKSNNDRGTLKALAQKVLKSSVPRVPTLESGTVGQSHEKSGTPVGQSRDSDELFQSMKRLEAREICIAVWEDGSMRVVTSKDETLTAIDDGGAIYSPQDMFHYVDVRLTQHERRMLHEFKKRFGGTVEWKDSK
jgi:hypothetical protein